MHRDSFGSPPAQQRAHSGKKFHDAEGLGDIVVRAEVEAADLVELRAEGGHYHDRDARRLRRLAQAAEYGEAVLARQHDVQQHQPRACRVQRREKLRPGGEALRLVARGAQRVGHQLPYALVVLHNVYHSQNPAENALSTVYNSLKRMSKRHMRKNAFIRDGKIV